MSRYAAAALVLGALGLGMVLVLGVMVFVGLDDRTGPIAVTMVGALATTATGAAAWARSTESAQEARHARGVAESTALQTAELQQDVRARCGELCPHYGCPLRRIEERSLS